MVHIVGRDIQIRVPQPPLVQDEDVGQARWLRQVADALNQIPNLSVFSFTTPNSNVTGNPASLGFNLGTDVDSSISALWIKQIGSGNTGWVELG